MDKLGFLLSKKILVVLSGFIFAGVTFASSGAGSLLQESTPENKVPEIPIVTENQSSPSPSPTQQLTQKSSSVSTSKPVITAATPIPSITPRSLPTATFSPALPTVTPKPSANTNLTAITGLRQVGTADEDGDEEGEEDFDESAINQAFQSTKEED